MTGDLQPLDVNFNRPFKSKFRPVLARLKRQRRDEENSNPRVESTSKENSAGYRLAHMAPWRRFSNIEHSPGFLWQFAGKTMQQPLNQSRFFFLTSSCNRLECTSVSVVVR